MFIIDDIAQINWVLYIAMYSIRYMYSIAIFVNVRINISLYIPSIISGNLPHSKKEQILPATTKPAECHISQFVSIGPRKWPLVIYILYLLEI